MNHAKYKWRLYEHEKCLGIKTRAEIEEITGMRKNNIQTYADTDSLYKGIYRIEQVHNVGFALEWEAATRKLLGGRN